MGDQFIAHLQTRTVYVAFFVVFCRSGRIVYNIIRVFRLLSRYRLEYKPLVSTSSDADNIASKWRIEEA